ncbi:MAG: hypothetical protein WA123_01440 [Methylotenera sp.]
MRTYMARQQMTMLVLMLIAMLHSPLLFAEVSSQSQSAMPWPVQAGESINDLARLFYPHDKYMQQQFAAAVIKLNSENQPDLNPAAAFDQESTVIIPSIKALSKKGKRKFTPPISNTSHVVSTTENLAVSEELQAGYDSLVKRNAIFKENLDALNAKLADLQLIFAALKTKLIQLVESAAPKAPVAPVAATVEQKSVKKPQTMERVVTPAHADNNSLKNSGMRPAVVNALRASSPWEQTAYIKLLVPVAAIFLAVGLFVGLNLYTRRQAEKIRFAATHTIRPLEKNTFFEKRSDLHSTSVLPAMESAKGVLSNVSSPDAAAVEVQAGKDEDELILEQAKIYFNLGKEDDAIQLLNKHIETAPKTALQHWLYLLDIYRSTNQKEAFLQSAKQLHRTFNVAIPRWEKLSGSETNTPVFEATSLEEYDYIVDKVTAMWAECSKEAKKIAQTKNYLDQLLTDNRNGERAGFSVDVIEDIMFLRGNLDAREKLALES